MAANDLNAPLRNAVPRPRRAIRLPIAAILSATAIGVAIAASVWVAVVDDPEGGRPVAMGPIEDAASATGSIRRAPAATGDSPQDAAPGTVASGIALARAPAAVRATADPLDTLIEPSAFGPLPVIGADGLRPLDAYARPPRVGPNDRIGRVVIIVGGLGISQTGTQEAIRSLPEDVTLAFAPYGGSLKRWVGKAREEGHEVLIQAPMEPFGYPETDPGPQTLLADGDDLANEENLHWVLGRITSYTGVMNYLGARFATEDPAMRWLLAELSGRGLMFVDDGTTPRSNTLNVAAAVGAPAIRADLVIDRVRSPAQIAAELERLEQIAHSRGLAVGVASAFPVSVDAIADWVAGVQGRGVAVVPASAALDR